MDKFSEEINLKKTKIAKRIIEKMHENVDKLFIEKYPLTKEDADKLTENSTDIGIDILKIIAEEEMSIGWISTPFDEVINVLTILKQFVAGSINSNEDEIMSRLLGHKDERGKYRKEQATVSDVMLALNELREKTGGNINEFINTPEEIEEIKKTAE